MRGSLLHPRAPSSLGCILQLGVGVGMGMGVNVESVAPRQVLTQPASTLQLLSERATVVGPENGRGYPDP